jgi:hypothetical protein
MYDRKSIQKEKQRGREGGEERGGEGRTGEERGYFALNEQSL